MHDYGRPAESTIPANSSKKFNSIQLMKIPAYRSLSNIEILQAELNNQHITLKSGMGNVEDDIAKVFQLRNKLIHSNFFILLSLEKITMQNKSLNPSWIR